jgi:hypothetical protein
MKSAHRPRARRGAVLLGAAAILALLAFPAFAAAKHHHRDRNHDGIPDRWEKRHHLSLKVNQAGRDQDHEGLDNRGEFENRTDPRDPDTDNDGLKDREDQEVGDDPNDADTDDDGIEDGQENAGTVESFDGTTLTIKLAGGGTLSGMVTDSTEIECERHEDGAQMSEDGNSGEDQGEDQGPDQEGQAGDGSGEDGSGENEGPGEGEACTTADLAPGATVHEAELGAASEGAVFEEIELEK